MHLPAYTFNEFGALSKKFGEGHFDLLIVVGSPGLSKSRTLKAVCPDARTIEGGNLSAFGFYCQLYEYRNQTIVVDDIDALYSDKSCVRLLKSVCQTEKIKTVGWHTASKRLPHDEDGEPITEFQTTSRLCIIANEWKSLNQNVAAVGDRGLLITFEPSAHEVHAQVRRWFGDKEILGFVADHLDEIAEPSMRTYVMASKLKNAGIDWQHALMMNWRKPIQAELAITKLARMKDVAENDKALIFEKWTGLGRASFFNWKRRMKTKE